MMGAVFSDLFPPRVAMGLANDLWLAVTFRLSGMKSSLKNVIYTAHNPKMGFWIVSGIYQRGTCKMIGEGFFRAFFCLAKYGGRHQLCMVGKSEYDARM